MVRATLRAFQVQSKIRVTLPISYFQLFVQPLILGAIGMILFVSSGQTDKFTYAVVGGGLTGLWSVTLYNASFDIFVERTAGTLEFLIGSPTPLVFVIIGKVGSSIAFGCSSFLFVSGFAFVFFGRLFNHVHALLFASSALITIISFFCLSLLIAPLFAWSRVVGSLVNGFEIPAYLLCGFMFPASLLPGWTLPFSVILAPYWSIRALYASAGQTSLDAFGYALDWSIALGLCTVSVVASLLLFKGVSARVRQTGQLAMG